MPIYEYRCSSCAFQKEYLQKVSDPLLSVCPACGKETFGKMLTAAGFQLKGSGWYATDFKGGAKPAAAGAGNEQAGGKPDTKAADNAGERSEPKTESKSDAGAAAKSDVKADTKPAAAPTPSGGAG